MTDVHAGAVPPSARSRTIEPGPTPDEVRAARHWALDHDREALLEHRIAVLTQAAWDVQVEAERQLVARFRCSLIASPQLIRVRAFPAAPSGHAQQA